MIGGNETFVCAFKSVFISGIYESNNKIFIVGGMVINLEFPTLFGNYI